MPQDRSTSNSRTGRHHHKISGKLFHNHFKDSRASEQPHRTKLFPEAERRRRAQKPSAPLHWQHIGNVALESTRVDRALALVLTRRPAASKALATYRFPRRPRHIRLQFKETRAILSSQPVLESSKSVMEWKTPCPFTQHNSQLRNERLQAYPFASSIS